MLLATVIKWPGCKVEITYFPPDGNHGKTQRGFSSLASLKTKREQNVKWHRKRNP